MLEAALAFAPLLEGWLRRVPCWRTLVSRPFVYAVTRGSLLSTDRLMTFYERLQARYLERTSGERVSYLGTAPRRLFGPVGPPSLDGPIGADGTAALVQTAELALDLPPLRALLRDALHAAPGVEALYGHGVEEVRRTGSGFVVRGLNGDGERWSRASELLVNCLWDGRLAVDAQLGIRSDRPWVYRLKYRVMGDLPAELGEVPSMTLVLGPYGDLVRYGSGPAYLSWYPACKRGWSSGLEIPPEWQAACDGRVAAVGARQVARETLGGLSPYLPGIENTRVRLVDAGVIFSWGASDIDDPGSELHRRHEIGVSAHDGYFSIDTGKLTSAPLFAQRLVQALQ
jgi:hypothetical protein